MQQNWTKVFTAADIIQAELIKSKLDAEGIPAAFVSKQDSMHLHLNARFGVEIFVAKGNAFKAVQLIEKMTSGE